MKLLVVAAHYPNAISPVRGVFVQNLVQELRRQSADVSVIAPIQSEYLGLKKIPLNSGKEFFPNFIKIPARVFRLNLFPIKQFVFRRAVFSAWRKSLASTEFDGIYAHFLFPAGGAAIELSKKLKVPAYLGLGESNFQKWEKYYSVEHISRLLCQFDRIFPNSPTLEKLIISRYNLPKDKVVFVPNGVDTSVFYPKDKLSCRKDLGLPLEEKILLFAGGFVERKGPLRVLAASKQFLPHLKAVFLGEGVQKPEGESVLFAGLVGQTKLSQYLSACDVFVLPTKSEGMPNIILEAMACNIPIATSDIPVNKFLLKDYSLARTCQSEDVDGLAANIGQLLNVDSRDASPFVYTLRSRAERILKEISE